LDGPGREPTSFGRVVAPLGNRLAVPQVRHRVDCRFWRCCWLTSTFDTAKERVVNENIDRGTSQPRSASRGAHNHTRWAALPAAMGAWLVASAAGAQTPEGIASADPATSGSTDVAQEGFQTVAAPPEESNDATTLGVSAGGLWATGNSRSLSLTGASAFRLRRDVHQLGAMGAVNYSKSAQAPDEAMEPTVENYQGRVRYDLFFAKQLAAFLQVSGRKDRFQGLIMRLNVDPGLAYYFIDRKQLQLWGEIGYDLQHDARRDEARTDPDTGVVAPKTETRHSARLFLGYDNKLNKAVSVNLGAEYLQGLSPYEDAQTGNVNWRLNFDMGLTSKVGESLAIATSFSLKYDNSPLAGLEDTDTVTAISLVYDLY